MADRAEVIAEMELLGIGCDSKPEPEESPHGNGVNGTPLTTEAAISAHLQAIGEISEMADQIGSRIEEIRETARRTDEALVELEVRLASLTTEEQ